MRIIPTYTMASKIDITPFPVVTLSFRCFRKCFMVLLLAVSRLRTPFYDFASWVFLPPAVLFDPPLFGTFFACAADFLFFLSVSFYKINLPKLLVKSFLKKSNFFFSMPRTGQNNQNSFYWHIFCNSKSYAIRCQLFGTWRFLDASKD